MTRLCLSDPPSDDPGWTGWTSSRRNISSRSSEYQFEYFDTMCRCANLVKSPFCLHLLSCPPKMTIHIIPVTRPSPPPPPRLPYLVYKSQSHSRNCNLHLILIIQLHTPLLNTILSQHTHTPPSLILTSRLDIKQGCILLSLKQTAATRCWEAELKSLEFQKNKHDKK